MRLVLISDTHTFESKVSVPEGDVLVHAGDLGLMGRVDELQPALDWLNKQPHAHIVMTAGNHDWAFAKKAPLKLGRIHYLEDSFVTLDGVKFYGSPVQPEFCNWAFNVPRGAEIKKYWDLIPPDTDVLITHTPPMGILDQSIPRYSKPLGCEELAARLESVHPKLHVFGHIHGGYGQETRNGTTFVNASVVNESYRVVNTPIIYELT